MANKVTIDVEARFVDNITDESKSASKAVEGIGKEADKAQKKVDNLSKKKARPEFDADNNKFISKIRTMESKMQKMGRTKTAAVLDLVDRASVKIGKALYKAKQFGGKVWRGILEFKDSKALAAIKKVTSGVENLTKKTWTTLVKVKDMALSPIKAIKNALFSIPTLITAVVTAKVVQKGIMEPISLADQYTNAKIGFSTLLGESAGQAMMNEIDSFAAATPFKTSNVISNVQKMMAYGWDVERVIDDMKTIGDAAAATGKGDQGLESIVYALSEIRSKGKLSTQELNQLASAGIKAKAYLAEGLGFGTDDAGFKKLAEALEDGAVGANQAIDLILEGMKEFDGMMDKTANTTVTGLKDQLTDLFEINVSRRWGQGLQEGVVKALGTITTLVDDADGSLKELGDTVFEIGQLAGNWVADKLDKVVSKVKEITESFEFQDATIGEKVSMLWNGIVADPLKKWWNKSGKAKVTETAVSIGKAVGEAVLKGVEMAWNALPWWGKMLVGGYAGGKVISGLGSVASGISTLWGGAKSLWGGAGGVSSDGTYVAASGLRGLLGSPGNYMVNGSGISGALASVGYKLTTPSARADVSGGMAMVRGLAALTGAAMTLKGAEGVVSSTVGAIEDFKNGDSLSGGAKLANAGVVAGTMTAGGVMGGLMLAGAKEGSLIGSLFGPGLGTAVGAIIGTGLGALIGTFAGDWLEKKIMSTAYETDTMKKAIKDGEMSAEELAKEFEKAKYEVAQTRYGDIALSMDEIARLSKQIVWGEDLQYFEKLQTASQGAEDSLQSMKSLVEDADKWMWKARLGVKFNDDEKEAFMLSFTDYFASAKSFLENKHYEFHASASLLLDLESEGGKAILDGGNAFFLEQQTKLDELGTQLTNAVSKALADGKISTEPITLPDGTIQLSEAEEIQSIMDQIAEITKKVSDAGARADIDLIKAKFGAGHLDKDSVDNLVETVSTDLQERLDGLDEAYHVQLQALNLRFENGQITKDVFEEQHALIISEYKKSVADLENELTGVMIDILQDPFADLFSEDDMTTGIQNAISGSIKGLSTTQMSKELKKALKDGIESDELYKLTSEDIAQLLGLNKDAFEDVGEETVDLLRDSLAAVLANHSKLNVDWDALLSIEPEEVKEKWKQTIPESMDFTITANLTAEANYANQVEILAENFGIEETEVKTIIWELYGTKSVLGKINYLASEFGIPQSEAEVILWNLIGMTGEIGKINPADISADKFGIDLNPTITPRLTVRPYVGSTLPVDIGKNSLYTVEKFRGGIVGGASAMGSFYRGGIAGYSDGGMVRGGSQLIEVAEEGSPEMIIPLSSQRRGRALKLWAQAGNIMGVPGFARGGMTSGGNDEGIRFRSFDSSESAGGHSVQVNVGGLTFEINVNGGDAQTITEAIKAQAAEIADVVAGVLADSLEAQFENMPARGGVA